MGGPKRFCLNRFIPEREDLMPDLVGQGTPLTPQGITDAAESLGSARELWA